VLLHNVYSVTKVVFWTNHAWLKRIRCLLSCFPIGINGLHYDMRYIRSKASLEAGHTADNPYRSDECTKWHSGVWPNSFNSLL